MRNKNYLNRETKGFPGRRTNIGMDCGANGDLCFLQDEKFDFDVTLSPASSKGDGEDEDEVFVEPVSHREQCVSLNIESQLEERSSGEQVNWGLLTGDQLEAVCQEAHRLADQLQTREPHGRNTKTTNVTTDINTDTTVKEEFVQDEEAKLGMLGQTVRALSPVKRQTFCVQDSPMKQLPPTIQRQLLRGRSSSTASSSHPMSTSRLSTSSPIGGAKTRRQSALRGKAPLGVAVVLPSKPAAPPSACSSSKNKVEKTQLQPPSKVTRLLRQSPSTRLSRRVESSEDLLSDSASVASDVSDSSLNSSLLGKRTLAPPTKCVRGRNLSGVKAPPLQGRKVTDRKNTSSSSSSVSSFNSSLSLSPAKGKLNSSLNRSLSSSTGHAPSSIKRPGSQSRLRRSTVYAAAEPVSSSTSRRSLSTQAKKPSESECVRNTNSTPLKRADTTSLQPTPLKRLAERTSSISTRGSGRLQNGVKAKPKPEALVLPAPSTAGKRVCRAAGGSTDGSNVSKPKRLMSAGSSDSLPQKPSVRPLTPSVSSCKPLLVASRRPSALPTPVKRRTSAIPAPTNQPHTIRSPSITDSKIMATPTSASKVHSRSPIPKDIQKEESTDPPEIQPFSLEEEEPSKTQEPNPSENVDLRGLTVNQLVPARNLIELETAEENTKKTPEVLLLDLSPPTLQPREKLLIDLTNTPELIRTNDKSCTTTQLIDLSSPLIKWSPEEKRENAAPLINLSF